MLEALVAIFIALIIAALICGAIALVAWGVLALVGIIPMVPDFVKQIIRVAVIVLAGLACIVVLIKAFTGGLPAFP